MITDIFAGVTPGVVMGLGLIVFALSAFSMFLGVPRLVAGQLIALGMLLMVVGKTMEEGPLVMAGNFLIFLCFVVIAAFFYFLFMGSPFDSKEGEK